MKDIIIRPFCYCNCRTAYNVLVVVIAADNDCIKIAGVNFQLNYLTMVTLELQQIDGPHMPS